MNKRGLGKGLDALLPEIEVDSGDKVQEVPIEDISPNPFQPRRSFNKEKIDELAKSIKEHGIIQPIILREKDGKYELVSGERRLKAAKEAGLEAVPAVVRDMPDQRQMEIAIIENVQREDLNPIEEAKGYELLIKKFSFTQEELSKSIGKSRSQIANTMRLLNLDSRVQKYLQEGMMSIGHGKVLAGLDKKTQIKIADKIARDGLSVREAEILATSEKSTKEDGKTEDRRKKRLPEYIKEVQERLKVELGTMVQMRYTEGKGKIEISYTSDEDLHRIMDLILDEEETEVSMPEKKKKFTV